MTSAYDCPKCGAKVLQDRGDDYYVCGACRWVGIIRVDAVAETMAMAIENTEQLQDRLTLFQEMRDDDLKEGSRGRMG